MVRITLSDGTVVEKLTLKDALYDIADNYADPYWDRDCQTQTIEIGPMVMKWVEMADVREISKFGRVMVGVALRVEGDIANFEGMWQKFKKDIQKLDDLDHLSSGHPDLEKPTRELKEWLDYFEFSKDAYDLFVFEKR